MADFQEVIINEVRTRPCLWDKLHVAYKDSRNVKNNNWQDVTTAVNQATGLQWDGKLLLLVLTKCY